VTDLGSLLREEGLPDGARRLVTGSINYLFKSLDLIPDGIEDLGFIDDAFVLRVAAALAAAESPELGEGHGVIARLSAEAKLIGEFLGADHARLEAYVKGLTRGSARGRSVDDIVAGGDVREAFLSEVASWVGGYEAPGFTREEKTLIKLKSFLDTKLPR
jgi:uncharacterized membrane protein YkvA (DUF1232 family)